MIRIVKNRGQCRALEGKSTFLLHARDKRLGDMYAKPGWKPIVGYIFASVKGGF